jgi:hypothetical protein
LKEKHSKYRGDLLCIRYLKLFIERINSLRSLALDMKCCRTVTGLLTGHCTLRQHLNIVALSESTVFRKGRQEKEFSYFILCQFPTLAMHRTEMFGCVF